MSTGELLLSFVCTLVSSTVQGGARHNWVHDGAPCKPPAEDRAHGTQRQREDSARPPSCSTALQARYLVGFVHPASGRTLFHLATKVSIPDIDVDLAAFACAVDASPTKQMVLIGDQAG